MKSANIHFLDFGHNYIQYVQLWLYGLKKIHNKAKLAHSVLVFKINQSSKMALGLLGHIEELGQSN